MDEGVIERNWLEYAISMPGAISSVFLISIFLPLMGWPKEITLPLLMSFSIPTLYVFFVMVILNRHISLRRHIPVVVLASFFLYIISRAPSTPYSLYVHVLLFLIGVGISTLTYFAYYLLYRFGRMIRRGEEELSYRSRFIIAFLPTLIIMMVILFFIGNIVIGIEDKETITIVKWLIKIIGEL